MAAAGGSNIGADLFARGIGQTPVGGGDGVANEKDIGDFITSTIPEALAKFATKFIPFFPNLMELGKVSIIGREHAGWAAGMINKGAENYSGKGGAPYNALFAPLMKNNAITDHSTNHLANQHAASYGEAIASSVIGGGADFTSLIGGNNYAFSGSNTISDMPTGTPVVAMSTGGGEMMDSGVRSSSIG